MIVLTLLISGYSKRFGQNKLFYPVEGKAMYLNVLEMLEKTAKNNPLTADVAVVSRFEEVKAECEKRGITYIQNNESQNGMSASIIAAVKNINAEYIMFFAGDMPYIKRKTVECFLKAFLASKKGIGCVKTDGIYTIPAVFSGKYTNELLALRGDSGARKIIERHGGDVFSFDAQSKEFRDIDTPSEL